MKNIKPSMEFFITAGTAILICILILRPEPFLLSDTQTIGTRNFDNAEKNTWWDAIGGCGIIAMGCPAGIESPEHDVNIASFWMDSKEVTQWDYEILMGTNPSYIIGDDKPVHQITWYDAALYCNQRSKRDGYDTVYIYTAINGTPGNGCTGLENLEIDYTKIGYRLPTEAEWEYACKGGSISDYYWGNDSSYAAISQYAWYYNNSDTTLRPVGLKIANQYGLYDICGNVYEWCNDFYSDSLRNTPPYYEVCYNQGEVSDPIGPDSGSYKVTRGGSILESSDYLKSYIRFSAHPSSNYQIIGFRCVLPVQ